MIHARQTTPDDIAELVRLRELLFTDLSAGWGQPPDGTEWRDACAAVLRDQLGDDGSRIVAIDGAPGLAACGVGSIDRRLPSPHNPSGLIGYVLNIVTDRRYRRRDYARLIMESLLRWFDDRDIRRVDLHASPDGQDLYRSLGFGDHPDPTLSRIAVWRNGWEQFTPFLKFPVPIRKLVYTTNAIESLSSRFRHAVNRRGHVPNDQAALVEGCTQHARNVLWRADN